MDFKMLNRTKTTRQVVAFECSQFHCVFAIRVLSFTYCREFALVKFKLHYEQDFRISPPWCNGDCDVRALLATMQEYCGCSYINRPTLNKLNHSREEEKTVGLASCVGFFDLAYYAKFLVNMAEILARLLSIATRCL